jgi:hypothetical protein
VDEAAAVGICLFRGCVVGDFGEDDGGEFGDLG